MRIALAEETGARLYDSKMASLLCCLFICLHSLSPYCSKSTSSYRRRSSIEVALFLFELRAKCLGSPSVLAAYCM